MKHKEALTLALEALTIADNIALVGAAYIPRSIDLGLQNISRAITAITEALAQPEQSTECGEPVAWYRDEDGIRIYYETKCWDDAIPLYTAPQPWEKFCDSNCVWTDHHPDCKLAEQEPVANGKLKVTLQDTPTEIELAQYKRMLHAACADLGAINEALGLDPNDGGAEPILFAIEELKGRSQEPMAWMVYTLDGTSVCVTDNPSSFTPEHRALPLYTTPPQRKPLDIKTIKRIATYCGEHITDEDVIEITRRVEEEHKIKK